MYLAFQAQVTDLVVRVAHLAIRPAGAGQAAVGQPAVTLDQGRCVLGGGNPDARQAAVAVVGIGGLATVGILAGDQFVSGVVAIALATTVEAGLFHQTVQQVVAELRLDAVLVGQGDQPAGFVVQVGQFAAAGVGNPRQQIAVPPGKQRGVPLGIGDTGLPPKGVVFIAQGAAVGQFQADQLPQRVVAAPGQLSQRVAAGDQTSFVVVVVTPDLAGTIGQRGQQAEAVPLQAPLAAARVDDSRRPVGQARVFVGVAGAAGRAAHRRRIAPFVALEGPAALHRVLQLDQQPGLFVDALAIARLARRLLLEHPPLAIAPAPRLPSQRIAHGDQAAEQVVVELATAAVGPDQRGPAPLPALAGELVAFDAAEAVADLGGIAQVAEGTGQAARLDLLHDPPVRSMDIPLVANLQPARFAVGDQHVLAPGEYPDHLAKTVAHGDQVAAVAELVAHQPVEPRALRIDVVRRRSVVAGQDHAEQTQAVVALARLAGLLVDQRIAAPGAVAHAGEQATSAPAELGAVAGAAEAGLQAPDTVGATLEMQVAVAGQHQHGALLRLQFGRHRRPAPAPGLRFAAARTAAAQPQLLAAGIMLGAGSQRRKADPAALGVDQHAGVFAQFQVHALARQPPAPAEPADTGVARQVATGEGEGVRRRQGEIDLFRQQLAAEHRVDRLAHQRHAGGHPVGQADRAAADVHGGRAGGDNPSRDFLADMGNR